MTKPLTLIVPYYRCPEFFRCQQAHWDHYRSDLQRYLSIIVVDDGSPEPAMLLPNAASIRLFRIERDVPWNWLAARNIGAHHAADGWLLLTDMDHVVPERTLDALIHGLHDPRVVYRFSRQESTGAMIHPHSASYLMTRRMFWQIGGYDERLSGVYGTDGMYGKRVAKVSSIPVLSEVLIRHEYQSDASVTTYERKTPAMRQLRRNMIRRLAPGSKPSVLTFPYHEVTA